MHSCFETGGVTVPSCLAEDLKGDSQRYTKAPASGSQASKNPGGATRWARQG